MGLGGGGHSGERWAVERFESPGVGSIEIGADFWKDYEVGVLRAGFADVLCHFCQRLY